MNYNEKVYKQWWNALLLSKVYKALCDCIHDSPEFDKDKLYPIWRENYVRFIKQYKKPEHMEIYFEGLWASYLRFGDVYRMEFNDWWKNKKEMKAVLTKQEYETPCLQYPESLRNMIINYPTHYILLYVDVNADIAKIKHDVTSLVQEQRPPLRYEPMRDNYLHALELKQKGLTVRKIIEAMGSRTERENSDDIDVQRKYKGYLQKARKLVLHAERGHFP